MELKYPPSYIRLIFSSWDLNTFVAMTPEERDAIIKALNDDTHKLISELEPNDPLAMRLKEELKLTNEHFYDLLNQMNRPKGHTFYKFRNYSIP